MKTYRVLVGSDEMDVTVDEEADGGLRVVLAGSTHHVDLAEVVPGRFALVVDGRVHDLAAGPGNEPSPASGRPEPGGRTVVVDGEAYLAIVGRKTAAGGTTQGAAARRGSEVRAPMPGLLVTVHAAEGAAVAPGQPLIIMEAMKMQMEIRAPRAGTVRRVHVRAGQEIAGDQLLVTIE
jgi:biotin carboxyl carrier protein